VGPKTQMGTTLASSSHFVVFELLHPRRQATVIVVGRILIFFVLAHSVDLLFNPSLSDFAFYNITFQLSFRLFLAVNLPGRSVLQNTGWNFTCDLYFCCMEHLRLFGFPVPRNITRDLRLIFIRS